MTTKQFEFLTFEEWMKHMANEYYMFVAYTEDADDLRITKKYKRMYALDFLTVLMEFVKVTVELPYDYEKGEYVVRYRPTPDGMQWTGSGLLVSSHTELFTFLTAEECYFFLSYEGCGTTSKEQLNILYNITE